MKLGPFEKITFLCWTPYYDNDDNEDEDDNDDVNNNDDDDDNDNNVSKLIIGKGSNTKRIKKK